MASNIFCGPCGYEDTNKVAKKWCTNCEEGFCEDCEKVHRSTRMSRNHKLISVTDYHKIKDVVVIQSCIQHGKKYDLYCPKHDTVLCIACVDDHKSCPQVIPLEAAVINAKQSPALVDLENTITGALQNVFSCINERELNAKEFENDEQNIKTCIWETRERLNKQLDSLELKLMTDLSTKTENCKKVYAKSTNQLSNVSEKLRKLKEETNMMKEIASDTQLFFRTRDMTVLVEKDIKVIKTLLHEEKRFQMNIKIDSSFTSALNASQLGSILVEERNANLKYKEPKLDRAQMPVLVPKVHNIQLKQAFKVEPSKFLNSVTGCIILPNGKMLIADNQATDTLIEYYEDGDHARGIEVSGNPFDLTLIDSNHIAVTYGDIGYTLDVIIVSDGLVEKTIQTQNLVTKGRTRKTCYGISHQDGKLYVIIFGIGIAVFDKSFSVLKTLQIDTESIRFIAVLKGMIYLTNTRKNTIHCLNSSGQEIWEYQDASIVSPSGLAVASQDELFVTSPTTNNLFLIQRNGKESKVLLKEDDGLFKTTAVHFNRERKELLLCNKENRYAAVYNVI